MTGGGGQGRPAPGSRAAVSPIDEPGTSATRWRAWPALAALPEVTITGWASVAVLAAHPDDEVLGAGGIIARLAAAGCRLRLIAVTDGEGSHPGHPDPAALARRRTRETGAALRELGAGDAEVIRLGLPDAGLTGRGSDIAARIADLVTGFDMCLAPWEGDLHGDHEAVGAAVRQLGPRACFYPVWMWHWAQPGDPRVPWRTARRVPLPPQARDRKQAAVRCFASQVEDRAGQPPMLSPGFLAHFDRDYDVLFPMEARP